MPEEFQVTKAVRKAVSMLVAVTGPSGSGKTMSGLILAGGMANGEQVGMLDAENGRGTLYVDDPLLKSALPNSFLYTAITPPYSPARYIMGLKALEKAGTKVAVIDSTSHEYEGEGGCTDIAENNKLKGMPNWALAKREHKRFMLYCLSSPMHIVFCLRAREKVKIIKDRDGKDQFVPQGMQPIAEKNFVYEMLLSLMFSDVDHHYTGIKVPGMLANTFKGGELITVNHGRAIRAWSDGGEAVSPLELLQRRARAHAEGGMAEYGSFFEALSKPEKKMIVDTIHTENKRIAAQADFEKSGESADGFKDRLSKAMAHPKWIVVLGATGYESWDQVPAEKAEPVLAEVEAELEMYL